MMVAPPSRFAMAGASRRISRIGLIRLSVIISCHWSGSPAPLAESCHASDKPLQLSHEEARIPSMTLSFRLLPVDIPVQESKCSQSA